MSIHAAGLSLTAHYTRQCSIRVINITRPVQYCLLKRRAHYIQLSLSKRYYNILCVIISRRASFLRDVVGEKSEPISNPAERVRNTSRAYFLIAPREDQSRTVAD